MNNQDPIADMLTRIRNANLSVKDELHVPASKMNEAIAGILQQEGYIESYQREGEGVEQSIRVQLKYGRGRERVITGLKRVSRPGLRRYVGADEIPRVLGGMGVAILSTSRGVLSGREAKKQKVGGELLAYVW